MLRVLGLLLLATQLYASTCGNPNGQCNITCQNNSCCSGMGGISYCDSSAGRYVCQNGYFSSCYCTRHAVMDIKYLEGCCLWQGGVATTTINGVVVCRDGTLSEECSIQNRYMPPSAWQTSTY